MCGAQAPIRSKYQTQGQQGRIWDLSLRDVTPYVLELAPHEQGMYSLDLSHAADSPCIVNDLLLELILQNWGTAC